MQEFDNLLGLISERFKSEGLLKKGTTYYILSDGNVGVINFQKSTSSTRELVKFTINLGVQSTILAKALNKDYSNRPSIMDCHWTLRIGNMMPVQQDYWWHVDRGTDIYAVNKDIFSLVQKLAIPTIRTYISDDELKKSWLNGISPGITEWQRFKYLTTLMKFSHDNRLAAVLDDLTTYAKKQRLQESANEHLKFLDSYEK